MKTKNNLDDRVQKKINEIRNLLKIVFAVRYRQTIDERLQFKSSTIILFRKLTQLSRS